MRILLTQYSRSFRSRERQRIAIIPEAAAISKSPPRGIPCIFPPDPQQSFSGFSHSYPLRDAKQFIVVTLAPSAAVGVVGEHQDEPWQYNLKFM